MGRRDTGEFIENDDGEEVGTVRDIGYITASEIGVEVGILPEDFRQMR